MAVLKSCRYCCDKCIWFVFLARATQIRIHKVCGSVTAVVIWYTNSLVWVDGFQLAPSCPTFKNPRQVALAFRKECYDNVTNSIKGKQDSVYLAVVMISLGFLRGYASCWQEVPNGTSNNASKGCLLELNYAGYPWVHQRRIRHNVAFWICGICIQNGGESLVSSHPKDWWCGMRWNKRGRIIQQRACIVNRSCRSNECWARIPWVLNDRRLNLRDHGAYLPRPARNSQGRQKEAGRGAKDMSIN